MRLRDPLTGLDYEVNEDLWQDLVLGAERNGDRWLSAQLEAHFALGGAQRIEPVAREDNLEPVAPKKYYAAYKTTSAGKVPPVKEDLTFPIIPELDEAGNKRLYKTRYTLLEKKYADLNNRKGRAEHDRDEIQADYDKLHKEYRMQSQKVQELTMKTLDSVKVEKRIAQLSRELRLEVPNMERFMGLSDKLEAFFGAVLCRVRNPEVEQDELAD